MNGEKSSRNGLFKPHVHYSFSKTASERLSQDESDSESLAQETEYQFELQKRINKTEKMVDQSYIEEDSLEEDSLEGAYCSGGEELDAGKTQIPNGTSLGKENHSNASNQEEISDKYSALRYDPAWKNDPERLSFVGSDESYQDCAEMSPAFSLNSIYSHSQFGLTFRSHQQQEPRQNAPPGFDREFVNSHDPVVKVSHGACGALNKEEQQTVCHFDSSPRTNSDSYSPHIREYKKKSETDFVEKNKVTLGLGPRKNLSYIQLHSKKQKGGHQGQAPLYQKLERGRTNSLEENSFSEMSNRSALGTQAELRSLKDRCHNVLELENTHASSNSYGEVSDGEEGRGHSLHHPLSPNSSVTSLHPSTEHHCSWSHQVPSDPGYSVDPNAKRQPMTVTFGKNPIELNPYPSFSGLHLPGAGKTKKKNQRHIEGTSGPGHQPPFRCTVSEPLSTTRHGKHQILVGCKGFSPTHKAGFPPPADGDTSSGIPRWIDKQKISRSHASGNSGPPQSPAHRLIQACSPTTRLIRAAEEHHLEISQLADDYLSGSRLATMFPPIMQRGESDSQIDWESQEGSQPVLSRSNSEGCLLQAEKEKEEKGKRQSYRTKGYVNMDVKLGGLGPDYKAVKEKSEKIKQQKEYAKHIQEHNMKNITNARKPPPRPEYRLGASRQKALEYAKTIPKPKLFVPRPSEPEPEEGKSLARTLNGENLPPISSLESLQSRHEKEKQVVAAFKTLHIV